MKELLKNKKGFTLMEMILALSIVAVIFAGVSRMYINISTSFFRNLDINIAVSNKSRLIHMIENDLEYNSSILEVSQSDELQITKNDSQEVRYVCYDGGLYRNSKLIISNIDIKFILEEDKDGVKRYITLKGNIGGKTKNQSISFVYPIELLSTVKNRWNFN